MFTLVKQRHYIQVTGAYTLEAIKEFVRDFFEGECKQNTGYYVSIEDVVILKKIAADKGHLKCEVEITARTYLPQVGARVKVVVEQYIKDRASLCHLEEFEKIKIFVSTPPTCQGDKLTVKITMARFQNGNYRFLGELE